MWGDLLNTRIVASRSGDPPSSQVFPAVSGRRQRSGKRALISVTLPCSCLPSVPPSESWHSFPAPAGASILPSVLRAGRQRRQVPARAWRETRSARGGRLSRDGAPSSLRAFQRAVPKHGAACSARVVWVAWGEGGVWSPELLQHRGLGSLGEFFESGRAGKSNSEGQRRVVIE